MYHWFDFAYIIFYTSNNINYLVRYLKVKMFSYFLINNMFLELKIIFLDYILREEDPIIYINSVFT